MPQLQALLVRPVIIFDLFHTLSTLRHSGVPGPETHELLEVSRESLVAALFEGSDARLRGNLKDGTGIVADIARRSGSAVSEDFHVSIAKHRANRFAESLKRISASVLDTLDCLKNHSRRLALISNADSMEGNGWEQSPLSPRFEVVLLSYQVGLVKPEPEIYEMCLSRLDVTADECVFVGDGGSNEFEGARSVGIPSICTTEFIRDIFPERVAECAAAADCVIESLSELCEAIT